MKLFSRNSLPVIVLLLFACIFMFGCLTPSGDSKQIKGADAKTLSASCKMQCTGANNSDCCKKCCKGDYVWTPESCSCHD